MTKEELVLLHKAMFEAMNHVMALGMLNTSGKSQEELSEMSLHYSMAKKECQKHQSAYQKALDNFSEQS